jgi:hypothetical protein
MFDLNSLAVIKQIAPLSGLNGIVYDADDDKIILTRRVLPGGFLTALNPKTGEVVANVELDDRSPADAVPDGAGRVFVSDPGKNAITVIDVKSWKVSTSWPVGACTEPKAIAYDKAAHRIFWACNNTSVVVDASRGKVIATIKNGAGIDGLGGDASKKWIYVANGVEGNVTVVHQDSPDKCRPILTIHTFQGAKTIALDPRKLRRSRAPAFSSRSRAQPMNAPAIQNLQSILLG